MATKKTAVRTTASAKARQTAKAVSVIDQANDQLRRLVDDPNGSVGLLTEIAEDAATRGNPRVVNGRTVRDLKLTFKARQ